MPMSGAACVMQLKSMNFLQPEEKIPKGKMCWDLSWNSWRNSVDCATIQHSSWIAIWICRESWDDDYWGVRESQCDWCHSSSTRNEQSWASQARGKKRTIPSGSGSEQNLDLPVFWWVLITGIIAFLWGAEHINHDSVNFSCLCCWGGAAALAQLWSWWCFSR